MSEYLPEVAWSTIASNVSLGLTTYRYYITVNPLDPNEAGASPMTVAINDWFIDFAGYPFLIEEVNGSILTVYDILERGDGIVSAYAPYANKLGYVYRPLNGAIILTQAQLRKLDQSAKDIIQPIEKGIQWAYRGIRLVSVDDDYSNITRLDLTNNLKYTYTENEGWQGGHKAELDLNIGLGTGALAEMEYTNNGDGTITIQNNTFMLYDNVLGIGYPKPYLVSGNTFSFTDNTYNYIVADYNNGTPTMYVTADVTLINETTIVPVFSVLRRGTVLCLTNWDTLGNAKIDKLHQSIVKTQRYRRQSGLAISIPSTGTPRRVSITGGIVWIGAVPVDLNATISGDVGVYMFEYYKSSSTWTYTLVSQINNTYYQGTTDRVELTSNRYAVAFIFRGVEHYNNHIYLVYGTGDYTLAQAQASGQPSDLPVAINSHAILVGRVIIQKSSDTITEIASAFDKAFLIQPVGDHAGLSNLGWTVSGHTGTAGSVPVFNSTGIAVEASLTNGYVPYKTTNGLGNSPISIDGTDVTIGTLNGLLLGTSGVLSAITSTESGTKYLRDDYTWQTVTEGYWSQNGTSIYYNGGNVGIGTSTPSKSLVINKNIANSVGASLMLWNNQYYANSGAETEIILNHYSDNGNPFRYAKIHTVGVNGDGAVDRLSFGLVNISDVYQDALTIKSTGNVGIGITSPGVKLDVSGTGRFTDKLYLGTSTAPTIDTGTLNALVWDNTTGEVKQRAISGGSGTGEGTVTSVAAGNGMNFTTITNSGSVTLGTPSALTSITTNSVTSNSHTHSIEIAHQTSITSSSTPTPTGNYKENEYYLTALAAGATFAAPGGTPVNGNTLLIRIKDNGTARTLAWNSIYRAVGVTLPTTTTASKTLYIGCIYNSTDSKWDVVSVVEQA